MPKRKLDVQDGSARKKTCSDFYKMLSSAAIYDMYRNSLQSRSIQITCISLAHERLKSYIGIDDKIRTLEFLPHGIQRTIWEHILDRQRTEFHPSPPKWMYQPFDESAKVDLDELEWLHADVLETICNRGAVYRGNVCRLQGFGTDQLSTRVIFLLASNTDDPGRMSVYDIYNPINRYPLLAEHLLVVLPMLGSILHNFCLTIFQSKPMIMDEVMDSMIGFEHADEHTASYYRSRDQRVSNVQVILTTSGLIPDIASIVFSYMRNKIS